MIKGRQTYIYTYMYNHTYICVNKFTTYTAQLFIQSQKSDDRSNRNRNVITIYLPLTLNFAERRMIKSIRNERMITTSYRNVIELLGGHARRPSGSTSALTNAAAKRQN